MKKRISKFLFSAYRYVFLFCLSIIILYPLLYSFSVAFRPAEQLYDPLVIYVPRSLTTANIGLAMDYLHYWTALGNTLLITLAVTAIQVFVCATIGYGLARYPFWLTKAAFGLVMLMIVVPPQTTLIANYLNFRYFDFFGFRFNLIDTPWTMILPALTGVGLKNGLYIFIFRQFFRGLPKDLEEAAAIDGCGEIKTFFRIMLSSAIPAIITCTLFSFVWQWNDNVYVSMYMRNVKTLMNELTSLFGRSGYIMQYELKRNPYESIVLLQAGVFLVILPPLVLYAFLQKYFIESIERTGVVG